MPCHLTNSAHQKRCRLFGGIHFLGTCGDKALAHCTHLLDNREGDVDDKSTRDGQVGDRPSPASTFRQRRSAIGTAELSALIESQIDLTTQFPAAKLFYDMPIEVISNVDAYLGLSHPYGSVIAMGVSPQFILAALSKPDGGPFI